MRIQESRASLGEIWKSRASLWGNTGGQLWDLGRFRCGSHQPSHCHAEDTKAAAARYSISHNVYNVGVIEARHCRLSLVGQGESYGETQCHCRGGELPPDGFFLATDRTGFADDSQDARQRQAC